MASEQQIDNFKKAIRANPKLSLGQKRERIETLNQMYPEHVRRAERME